MYFWYFHHNFTSNSSPLPYNNHLLYFYDLVQHYYYNFLLDEPINVLGSKILLAEIQKPSL